MVLAGDLPELIVRGQMLQDVLGIIEFLIENKVIGLEAPILGVGELDQIEDRGRLRRIHHRAEALEEDHFILVIAVVLQLLALQDKIR